MARTRRVRQAVVIVHGMGEQRPLDTLNEFIGAALDPGGHGKPEFYSRPDEVSDSYESRRYLARPLTVNGQEMHAQTEFYEYHWAHLMQGNRLEDLWPTFRRVIFLMPWFVPAGLRVVWALFWALAIVLAVLFVRYTRLGFDWSQLTITNLVGSVLGSGIVAILVSLALTYLATRITPRWITSSFVDVVRYLDTSPRSYAVRKEIRAGMISLLKGLHDSRIRGKPRYQRIVIVAHSLGTYIAYDAITFLWGQMNELHQKPMDLGEDATGPKGGIPPNGLDQIEVAAAQVGAAGAGVESYRLAQQAIWRGLREEGNPWLITDFISLGSPMYFADRLVDKGPHAVQGTCGATRAAHVPATAGRGGAERQQAGSA